MNTQNNKNTAAPSVTIAPRSIGGRPQGPRGVLNYIVTLTTAKEVRSYPCRSMESAIKLAERFIAGVSRHSQATADVTKPRKETASENSAPSTTDTQPSTPVAVAA